jgi:DNA-binding transcriptional regulator YhcF (GntR family)
MSNISAPTRRKQAKWQQIYKQLHKDIISGKYPDKSEFFTLKELCQKFAVSNITAQRIFKELKLAGLIATTGRRGTIVTNNKKTNRILLCLFKSAFPKENQPFIINASYKYFEGFLNAKADTPFEAYPVSEEFLWENLNNIEDDVILSSDILLKINENSVTLDTDHAEILREKINPVIIHSVNGLHGFPRVGIDYYQGFYDATTYLLKKGHTKISFLMTSDNIWHSPRLKGYMDALEHNGFIFDTGLTKVMTPHDAVNDWNLIQDLIHGKSSSAILCSSDQLALRINTTCKQHGIRVPDDLAIMGFDNIGESTLASPALTTMDTKLDQFGQVAINLLERRRAGFDISNENIKIIPTLIERETT